MSDICDISSIFSKKENNNENLNSFYAVGPCYFPIMSSNEITPENSDQQVNIFHHILSEIENSSIDGEPKEIEKNSKNLGRKRKGETTQSKKQSHDKMEYNNIIRKIKPITIDSTLKYINSKLNKSSKYILMKINQSQAEETSIEFNKLFLYKSIKDIFSDDVSKNCSKIISEFGLDYNKKLIEQFYKKNEENGSYVDIINILDKNFLEILKHCRGSEKFQELDGLKEIFDEKIGKVFEKSTNEYKKRFLEILNNYEIEYEKKYENKKARMK